MPVRTAVGSDFRIDDLEVIDMWGVCYLHFEDVWEQIGDQANNKGIRFSSNEWLPGRTR